MSAIESVVALMSGPLGPIVTMLAAVVTVGLVFGAGSAPGVDRDA